MNVARYLLGLVVLVSAVGANAQMSELPETATGARAVPPAIYKVGLGAYFGGFFHDGGLSGYIWGKMGDKIEDQLEALDIDITDDAGVISFDVVFVVGGRPFNIKGEIDKKSGETLKKAFERNYAQGILKKIDRALGTRLYQEMYLMEETISWFNYQGSYLSHAYFGGFSDGLITYGRARVTISDCDEVCEDPP